MKDLYSFHADKTDLDKYYEEVKKAYARIFKQLGLGKDVVLTFASGGSFSKYSHEFQAIAEVGEDTIYLCDKCQVAVNEEIIKEQNICPECGNKNLQPKKAVEVGNIFKLGTKFSEAFGLTYKTAEGQDKLIEMGCYGMGPGRIIGVIAELFHDEKGILWPSAVAPFQAHLLALSKEKSIFEKAEKIYQQLTEQGIEVLYDDRTETSAGVKFADADLIGIPTRIVVSEKTLVKESVEIKKRQSETTTLLPMSNLKKPFLFL